MRIDPQTLLVILGMAVVTYATRAGGLLLTSRATLPGWAWKALEYTPGAILVSLVAVAVASGGVAEALAALAAALVAARTGNPLLALVAGVGTVLALRVLL